MGFSFGFTDDIEEYGEQVVSEKEFVNPIDAIVPPVAPKLHTLSELIQSTLEKRLTYEAVESEGLYRRELYDVRHQLMVEDDGTVNNDPKKNEEFGILVGETDEDLKNGVYEGGLKSWECSFDVINSFKSLNVLEKLQPNTNIIELGCGTSLPSLYILKHLFQNPNSVPSGRTRFVLSDFNYDVLRLVTLPNIIINWCSTLPGEYLEELQKRDVEGNVRIGEIDCTTTLINAFTEWLGSRNIELYFISGGWCREFMNIIHSTLPGLQDEFNITVTSETIYSPAILPVISEVLIELHNPQSTTILSAKDIYFGVGGSIVDCLQYFADRKCPVVTTSIPGNLKRSVVQLM